MSLIKIPHGFEEIVRLCGDPRSYLGPDGVMSIEESRQWETSLGLVLVPFPEPLQLAWGHPGQVARVIRCHPIAADPFRSAFRTIHAEGLWHALKTFGGGFTVRPQRGNSAKWSTHAFGLAGDFDVANNQLGETPRMEPAIVRIFEACGFKWGGDWPRKDGMHLQFCTGY